MNWQNNSELVSVAKISEDAAMISQVDVETAKVLLADQQNLKEVFDRYDCTDKDQCIF